MTERKPGPPASGIVGWYEVSIGGEATSVAWFGDGGWSVFRDSSEDPVHAETFIPLSDYPLREDPRTWAGEGGSE